MRNTNIELLRIILLLMVCLIHGLSKHLEFSSLTAMGGGNALLYTLSRPAVNCFVMITGYFMGKKQLPLSSHLGSHTKVFIPLLVCIPLIYLYVLSFQLDKGFVRGIFFTTYSLLSISDLFHHLWYIIGYVWLLLLAPYLNVVLNKLQKTEFRNLIIFSSVIFVGLSSLDDFFGSRMIYGYTFNSFGEQGCYNIILFIILYMIGGYISKFEVVCHHPLAKFLFIGLLLTALTFGYSHFGRPIEMLKSVLGGSTTHEISLYEAFLKYNNIFVIMMAYYFFMFFKQLDVKNKTINTIARGTYSGYIIHMVILSLLYFIVSNISNVEAEYPFYQVKSLPPYCHILIAVCTLIISLLLGYLIDYLINIRREMSK